MDNQSAAQAYREATFENAPPIKIIRMLYEGALRFIDQARAEDISQPNPKFNDLVFRIDGILTELQLALDHDVNPEVCANLEQLYVFCGQRLNDVRLNHTQEPLEEIRKVLQPLAQAWRDVELPSETQDPAA